MLEDNRQGTVTPTPQGCHCAPVTAPPSLRPSFRRARPPCLVAAPAMGSRQLLDEMPELAEVAALVDTAAVGAVLG